MELEALEQAVFAAIGDSDEITQEMKDDGMEIYTKIFTDPELFGFCVQSFPEMAADTSKLTVFRASCHWLTKQKDSLSDDCVDAMNQTFFEHALATYETFSDEIADCLAEAQAAFVFYFYPEALEDFWSSFLFTTETPINLVKRFVYAFMVELDTITGTNFDRVILLKEYLNEQEVSTAIITFVMQLIADNDATGFRTARYMVDVFGDMCFSDESNITAIMEGIADPELASDVIDCLTAILRKAGDQREAIMDAICPPSTIAEWSENVEVAASVSKLLNEIGCTHPEYATTAITYVQTMDQEIVMNMIDFMRDFLVSAVELELPVESLIEAILTQIVNIISIENQGDGFHTSLSNIDELCYILAACFTTNNQEAAMEMLTSFADTAASDGSIQTIGAIAAAFRVIFIVSIPEIENEEVFYDLFMTVFTEPVTNDTTIMIPAIEVIMFMLRYHAKFVCEHKLTVITWIAAGLSSGELEEPLYGMFSRYFVHISQLLATNKDTEMYDQIRECMTSMQLVEHPDFVAAASYLMRGLPHDEKIAGMDAYFQVLSDALDESRESHMLLLALFKSFSHDDWRASEQYAQVMGIYQEMCDHFDDTEFIMAYLDACMTIMDHNAVTTVLQLMERITTPETITKTIQVLSMSIKRTRVLGPLLENYYNIITEWFPYIQEFVDQRIFYEIECNSFDSNSVNNTKVIANYVQLTSKVLTQCAASGIVDEDFTEQMCSMVWQLMNHCYNSPLVLTECNEFLIVLVDRLCPDRAIEQFASATMNFILSKNFVVSNAAWIRFYTQSPLSLHARMQLREPELFEEVFNSLLEKFGLTPEWGIEYLKMIDATSRDRQESVRGMMKRLVNAFRS